MSITLEDVQGKTLKVNVWNWGVLHHNLACANPPLFEDENLLVGLHKGGVTLDAEHVEVMLMYLVQVVLPEIDEGQRMFLDFSVTDESDDGTLHRDDPTRNYSLHYDVLAEILIFLDESTPPIKVY